MLKNLLNYKFRILATLVLVFALAIIRAYEDFLFYDPFLNYFKSDYTNLPLPETERVSLFLNLLLRYSLNTALSMLVIHVIFKKMELVVFALVLYAIFFVILASGFFITLEFIGDENKMMLFYIRRFLIQPIFLLLFIPAFYFQERASTKNNVS